MKCLHICNDLMGSKVHENLYLSLEKAGLDQVIYYPLRKHTVTKVPQVRKRLNSNLITSKELSDYHRVLFRKKIKLDFTIMQSIALFNVKNISFICQDFF